MPNRSARTDDPALGWWHERDTKQVFSHRTRNAIPRDAVGDRMKNRALIADHPAGFLRHKSDCIQRYSLSRGTDGPTLTAVGSEENFPTLADGPAMWVVDEKDVGEIVAPAFGESLPG